MLLQYLVNKDPPHFLKNCWIVAPKKKKKNSEIGLCFSFRCLELQPNNLKALMALAVSYTNTGHQQDACEALKNWIKQNPKYKYLVKSKKGSPGLTRRMSKTPVDRYPSRYITAGSIHPYAQ